MGRNGKAKILNNGRICNVKFLQLKAPDFASNAAVSATRITFEAFFEP
ncbi:hypothetical protein LV83_03598 [Algoriphagus yeomjeoni]|uniref:Uncharacterized protein n=1 Tax=Algoriphagus yeomjeoni TaxID=291403 RepID=A0A327P4L4_9BACT|nr:hypothetical protein LV83_03598 [Algoriphagus yeomjeoni]